MVLVCLWYALVVASQSVATVYIEFVITVIELSAQCVRRGQMIHIHS